MRVLDALVGGVGGMLIGSSIYAAVYPKPKDSILDKGSFGDKTLIDVLPVKSPWAVIAPVVLLIAAMLWAIEAAGY